MAISPVPAFPALSDRATGTYNSKAFAWASHMADTFAPEVNALTANLNSIAAGGAYANTYIFRSGGASSIGTAAGGSFTFINGDASLLIDIRDGSGAKVDAAIIASAASSSSVRGTVRIVKQNDPSTWLIYNVVGPITYDASGLYLSCPTSLVAYTKPLSNLDPVTIYFQRTGDKGDKGDAAPIQNFPTLYVRDEKAVNTGGGNVVGTVMTRVLNTVKLNTIPGASLSSSLVSLPAGTYEYVGSVPAYCVNAFRAQLWNSTDGVYIDNGTSEYSDAASGRTPTRSIVRGSFTIASSKNIALRMVAMNGGAGNLGVASNDGGVEVYSELWIKKVA